MLSPDARVALWPEATYLELVRHRPTSSWSGVARPALVLLVLATGVSIAAVHQITVKLVLTTAAAWSAIIGIQVATGAALIASVPTRRVGFVRALDLWFAGHMPYTLWILALPLVTAVPVGTPHELMGVAIVVPLLWTSVIVAAFCRVVLGLSPAAARRRAVLHLAVVIVVGGALVVWAAGGPAAIVSYALRRLNGVWS